VSPVELTQGLPRAHRRLNPTLNAFITVTGEQALADAKAAETLIVSGKRRGRLHGIPIALKDLFDTAGVRTTAGSAIFRRSSAERRCGVVRRLRALAR
jgi:aspartyl-tRNA(Asn)/glutamyl-tRNA(Gln) amidotransferase subunit A